MLWPLKIKVVIILQNFEQLQIFLLDNDNELFKNIHWK